MLKYAEQTLSPEMCNTVLGIYRGAGAAGAVGAAAPLPLLHGGSTGAEKYPFTHVG